MSASSLEDAYARLQTGLSALAHDVEQLEEAPGGGGDEAKAEATVRCVLYVVCAFVCAGVCIARGVWRRRRDAGRACVRAGVGGRDRCG